ncbi:MAG: hypothetical protein HYV17_04040 [Xanthomonadales bacterium]|nr:hypothetical protein [Xanthomonadales bacterium]
MEWLLMPLLCGLALFALAAPIYLGVRVLSRRRQGVSQEFAMAYWLLSSATQLLLAALLLISAMLPVELPLLLFLGGCLLGTALSFTVTWLQPEGWNWRDFGVSIGANLGALSVMLVLLGFAASMGGGH